MAFQLLGLATDNLLTDIQLQEFSSLVELPMSKDISKNLGFKMPKQTLRGDRIMHLIHTARQYDMPVSAYCRKARLLDIPLSYLEDIHTRYEEYKLHNSLYDYTDMLAMIKHGDVSFPELDYLFIDEAQDLSTLQWYFVNKLAENSKNIIIAGDDKQSINEFAGADVDTFLHLPGKVEVLEQSYRIPKQVFDLANKVMKKYMKKYRKEGSVWKPREEEGSVNRCSSLPLEQICTEDSWLILTRSTYQLGKVREAIMRYLEFGPCIFTIEGLPPIDLDVFRVIDLYRNAKLRNKSMSEYVLINEDDNPERRKSKIEYIRLFRKFISMNERKKLQPWEVTESFLERLNKETWAEAFDLLKPYELRYIAELYKQHSKGSISEPLPELFKNSEIRLMTIHKAKGREADNVVVLTGVPRAVKQEIAEGTSDIEAKIVYVAITRTRQNLYICSDGKNTESLDKYL